MYIGTCQVSLHICTHSYIIPPRLTVPARSEGVYFLYHQLCLIRAYMYLQLQARQKKKEGCMHVIFQATIVRVRVNTVPAEYIFS
jgi:hypothetical protein